MSDFWHNKRVLVTGGTGFLGRHLCAKLRELGADVIAASSEHDLALQDEADTVFQKLNFSPWKPIVFHLAAQCGGIGANMQQPGYFCMENLLMGANVIERSALRCVEKFVQVGTVCSYPKHTPVPFKEDDLWNGYPEETNAPYGIAKKALLTLVQAYRQQYGFPGIYLIPVNLYGPGDHFDLETSHVIPALIRKCIEARDSGAGFIKLWGTGAASREFLYVEDCVEALVLAAEKYDSGDPVNIGTGKEITIEQLVHLIADIVQYEGGFEWDDSKPDGQPRRCLDTSRARAEFGFEARTGLLEGLAKMVEWYEGNKPCTG